MNRMKEAITDIVFTEGAVIIIFFSLFFFLLFPIEVDYLKRVTEEEACSADQQHGHVRRVIFMHDGVGNLNCLRCGSAAGQVSEIRGSAAAEFRPEPPCSVS